MTWKHERRVGRGARRGLAMGMWLALASCGDDAKDMESPVETRDASANEDAGPPRGGRGGRGGSGGAGGRDAGMSAGGSCGDVTCKAPATCDRTGQPRCVCPDGYEDPPKDGSCVDVDECQDDSNDCDPQATCKNTAGSYECECRGPAYRGDGKTCDCADGYAKSDDGLCLASDGRACGDDLDCSSGHCVDEICCAVSCENPETCQTTEGASCQDGKTCKYPTAKDGASCDDSDACTKDGTCKAGSCELGTEPEDCDDKNPCTDDSCMQPAGCVHINNTSSCDDGNACTTGDACLVGTCQGTDSSDCSDEDDACNVGECNPDNGECRAVPRAESAMCDDANSCTLMDVCMAGSCMGNGNACRQNATACMPGAPNRCECKDGFVDDNGVCVPEENECDGDNSCSEFADCFDPSNVGGDVTCTCRAGYTGNGTECTRSNPCEGNPCGENRGACTAGDGGAYTCSCVEGYKEVNGTCVCDLGGTFAVRTQMQLRWADVEGGIEDGNDAYYTYFLTRHTYDDEGKLEVELQMCGLTSFDLCGLGQQPFFGAEAYSDFYPIHIWDLPSMPRYEVELSLPRALPGEPFVSPNFAVMYGVTLADPLGAWPSTRADVSGSSAFDGSAVNGAAWVDHDADNQVAITDVIVPPGGIRSDGTNPDPITQFGATSNVCPRRSGAAGVEYAYWPALPDVGLTPVRVSRAYTGLRMIQAYAGSITSCDAYGGELRGLRNDRPSVDARIGGCMRVNGGNETNCSARSIDSLDGTDQNQEVTGASFKAKRIASNEANCQTVRATNFD